MLGQTLHDIHLLLGRQALNRRLNHSADAGLVDGDETLIIHKSEKTHNKLTIHAIRHAAMAGDAVAEILDVEGAFQAAGEEAAEGGDEGGEGGHDEDVALHGGDGEFGGQEGPVGRDEGQAVGVRDEDRVRGAV